MKDTIRQQLREWGSFLATLVLLVFSFNTLAFAAFHVPSESMLPTLRVGDHFYAAKFAFGYSRFSSPLFTLPVGEGRLFGSLPDRGDVIVMRHPKDDGTVLVKRAIGLPGDRIQVKEGRLFINDTLVERVETAHYAYAEHSGGKVTVTEYRETLPGGHTHLILERSDSGLADNTPEYLVPPNHVFVMGDNRDNSVDSRFLDQTGTIPADYLLGRVGMVNFNMDPCTPTEALACPGGGFTDRLLKRLD
jgi:signal peptidase I